MRTRVKICGITRLEDAKLAEELGADALGFNFYRPSPRYIAPASAREIIFHLAPFVIPVGVFADETDTERIASIAQEAGVQVIQLHGAPLETVGSFPLIRAVAVGEDGNENQMAEFIESATKGQSVTEPSRPMAMHPRAILLDTQHPELRGGTGRTFDWKKAKDLARLGPVILAGGLTPDNVFRAIQAVRPYAVDVASGVEGAPGIKDPAKLRAFFAAVREADQTF